MRGDGSRQGAKIMSDFAKVLSTLWDDQIEARGDRVEARGDLAEG